MVNYYRLEIILFHVVCILFVLTQEYLAIFIWTIVGLGTYRILKFIGSPNHELYIFRVLYFIFSLIGLIIMNDNYRNFGELTGYASDDTHYLNGILFLQGVNVIIENEISPLSYFLAIISGPLSLFKTVSLADLLPFNWSVAALIGINLNKISIATLNKNIPIILILITYPLHFVFTDTFTRFYRDVFLLYFLTLFIYYFIVGKRLKSVVYMLVVGILRVGNTIFFPIFMLLKYFKVNSIPKIITLLIPLVITLSISLPFIVKTAIIYGSELSRLNRYQIAFQNVDIDDVIEIRFREFSTSSSPLMSYAYSNHDPTAIIARFSLAYLYPLGFDNPFDSMYYPRYGTHFDGFYAYRVINWLNSFLICFTAPLLVIGLSKNVKGNFGLLVGLFFIITLLIGLISGQLRHFGSIFILIPIICCNGYLRLIESNFHKKLYHLMVLVSLTVIFSYNFIL